MPEAGHLSEFHQQQALHHICMMDGQAAEESVFHFPWSFECRAREAFSLRKNRSERVIASAENGKFARNLFFRRY